MIAIRFTSAQRILTKNIIKTQKGWLKISARGKEFRMTAKQVLNHLLPAIARVKPNITLKAEHHETEEKDKVNK